MASGCGGKGDMSIGSSDTGASTANVSKTVEGKTEPKVTVPDIPRPKRLVVKDLEVGHGPKAGVGDDVKVEYTGVNWAGQSFSDSWKYRVVPVFELGGHRLEYGLDLGVRGMKAGGRREVIFPPRLIYWPDEPHAPLGPVNTLVFTVDLFQIRQHHS